MIHIWFDFHGFDDYRMELYHISKLYYEEVTIHYESHAEANLKLELRVTDHVSDSVEGVLWTRGDEQSEWTAQAARQVPFYKKQNADLTPQEDTRRVMKRAILSCTLQLLTQWTGLEQPWGTLTGVRPTKLLHEMMRKQPTADWRAILSEEYLLHQDKIDLLIETAERQLKVIPDLFELDREVSIYIGIPFCPTKCAYCTFPAYDIRGTNGSVEAFLEGLHYEIRETGRWLKEHNYKITSMYWGGGTPTSITAEQMDALFVTLHESFPRMDDLRELTVEAGRPDTITVDKLEVMKKWKVDRISINPQSFTQLTLDLIGRHHTVTETIEKFKLSRELGMRNINMDLIIGLPNEGIPEFAHTLEETGKLLPESLTVHTLSFKRGSKMTNAKEKYEVAERNEVQQMMEMANQWVEQHEYQPYYLYRQKNILGNLENVGYALEGHESVYNIVMMEERQTIVGLGCGAVSKILFPKQSVGPQRIERFPNPKEPTQYNENYKQYTERKLKLLEEAVMVNVKS